MEEVKTIEKTDLEKAGLSGPVKQVMQACYKAHQDGGTIIQGKLQLNYTSHNDNYIKTFDASGKRTEVLQFGTDGIHKNVYTTKHDFATEVYQYSKDWTLRDTTKHKVTEKCELIETISLTPDGARGYKSFHKFNAEGKNAGHEAWHVRNGKDELYERGEITYDENGNMLSIITYDGKGRMTHQSLMKYNEKGLRIDSLTEWMKPEMASAYSHYVSKYNEHDDCIETISYDQNGNMKDVWTHKYEYDSEGKKIVAPHPPFIPPPEPGDEPGETVTDARGNWIKKITFINKLPRFIYLREFAYADDPEEKKLKHPVEDLPEESDEVEDTSNKAHELSEEEVKFIAEAPAAVADNFPYLRYYALRFKEPPSLVTFTGPYIEVMVLLKELKDIFRAQEIHSYNTVWDGNNEELHRYTLNFSSYWGYMLHVPSISRQNEDEFDVPDNMDLEYDTVYTGQVQLLRPSEASGNRDSHFELHIRQLIEECSMRKKPDKPVINIIEVSGSSFAMRQYAVDDNFIIKNLDINYGAGFEKFHNDLMYRFVKSTKGLVLFHGQPGTGKTYYIRHLLRRMVSGKKNVIYMPPNMVDHLVEPAFMTFLTKEIEEMSNDGYFCVLLIEDAEPLLARRQEGVRIQGITNLLNMSDGLLNDLLNLQIICTFNVALKKLDSALLRPGRLIARKEFKALSVLDANLLAQRLGIKHHFTAPATLGEIYSMQLNHNTIVHDVDYDKDSSTALDDLL